MGLRAHVVAFTLGAGAGAAGTAIAADVSPHTLTMPGLSGTDEAINRGDLGKAAKDTIRTALVAVAGGSVTALSAWYFKRRADRAAQSGLHRQAGTTCTNLHTIEKQDDGRIEVKILPGGEFPTPLLFREESLTAVQHSHTRAFHRAANIPLVFRFRGSEEAIPVGLMRFLPQDERHVLQGLLRRNLNDEKQAMVDALVALRIGRMPTHDFLYVCFRKDAHADQPTTWINKFPSRLIDSLLPLVTPETVRFELFEQNPKLKAHELIISGVLRDQVEKMFTVPTYREVVITDMLQIAIAMKFGSGFNQHGILSATGMESPFAPFLAPIMKVPVSSTREWSQVGDTVRMQTDALLELALRVTPDSPEMARELAAIAQALQSGLPWAAEALENTWS